MLTSHTRNLSESTWQNRNQQDKSWPESQWLFRPVAHVPLGEKPDMNGWDSSEWLETEIPFDAITALFRLGRIGDPMVGFGDRDISWVEDCDWLLKTTFPTPNDFQQEEEEWVLHLRNLDCFADVYINRHFIGRCRNAFREHAFEVDRLSTDSPNELLIHFRSAKLVTGAFELAYGQLPSGFDTARVHARRCQCLTGWDWASRLSSVSLLSPPFLYRHAAQEIANPHAWCISLPECAPGQETTDNAALTLAIDISSTRRCDCRIRWQVADESGSTLYEAEETHAIRAKALTIRHNAALNGVHPWWPTGMGAQPMYRLTVRATFTDRAGNTFETTDNALFGIRTAVIRKERDSDGESFTPLVNGVPVFCRGANWIPVNMLPAQAGSKDYELLLAAAVGSGMNCLRVWGGGIYEPTAFHDLCDRLGILVWQDFMFACAAYPVYRDFLDEVEAEALYQVKRLRNHPSLLLWCGNNENEWLHQVGSLKKGVEHRIIGETIWSGMIKSVVEEHDPGREYHQSSPFGKNRLDYNDEGTGDRHNWDAWGAWQPTNAYLADRGRFLSEFGFQGMPDPETLRRYTPSADSPFHPELLHHQKMPQGQERLARYMAELTGVPGDLDAWVQTTREMQSEVLRRAVEHWRRRRFHCAGTLIWQLQDAYPAISWSLIDFEQRPKPSLFAARRFFSPVLLSFGLFAGEKEIGAYPPEEWPRALAERAPGIAEFLPSREATRLGDPHAFQGFLINDTSLDLGGEIHIQVLAHPEAEPVQETISVIVPANQASPVISRNLSDYPFTDYRTGKIDFQFTPDAETMEKLDVLQQSVRETVTRVTHQAPDIIEYDLSAGLQGTLFLVEKLHRTP